MYGKKDGQLEFSDFAMPFSGRLSACNRWIKLEKEIPWNVIEERYSENFSKDNMGAPAKPLRMALGALIIKERLAVTDEEAVEQIRENPYLQYFTGLHEYQEEAPFDPSMMVHFRKRINLEMLAEINELIISGTDNPDERRDEDSDNKGNGNGVNKKEIRKALKKTATICKS